MNRTLCTNITSDSDDLIVHFEVRVRGVQHSMRVRVPWKWLASSDAWDRLEAEHARRGRPRARGDAPWLPLESWE